MQWAGRVFRVQQVALLLVGAALGSGAAVGQTLNVEAARALMKDNECTKCHAIDKEKKGPSYKKIAEKYRGKPDGEEKAVKSMTTGPKVKLDDGTQEDHKIVDTKDVAAIKNLARWILSQ